MTLVEKEKEREKARKRRQRDYKYKKHLIDIINNAAGYPAGAYWSDYENGVPTENAYPKRSYRGKRSAYYKAISNRKLRRAKAEAFKGGKYKKFFEFWWTLY